MTSIHDILSPLASGEDEDCWRKRPADLSGGGWRLAVAKPIVLPSC